MGLWNFVKSAGKALGLEAVNAEEAPARDAIKKELDDLGLKSDGVEIDVQGDKVKVKGKTASQELKEKLILAMGNIAGVAEVEDDVETDAPGTKAKVHTVKSGETLWKIAEATLGDGSRYPEIFEANKPMLSDPDKIYPGQVLRIPQ